ncbi:MAG: molybdenum cofactor guanylyltransferase MobA [Geminicoccaceae bacterium]
MNAAVTAVLLAGGLARRMGGGDKALIELQGKPLVTHAIERLKPQVEAMVLNANGDAGRFSAQGLPVVADTIAGFAGPLAGILAGMRWSLRNRPDHRWLLSVPTDTPFLPADLVERLMTAREQAGTRLACAASAGRTHPVVGLWDVTLADDLEQAMIDEGMRKIDLWTARHGVATAGFAGGTIDPFFNINRPEDIGMAEEALAQG